MNVELREAVRERAGGRCEYCHLAQRHQQFHPFHIEHIVARQRQGSDDFSNLALACHQCNLHKGPNLTSVDPDTGEIIILFHPRRDMWDDHFRWDGPVVAGKTATGRTTAWLLAMNSEERVELRRWLIILGAHS